ncbi:cytochrome d ubiquinol oxidase subunit II [Cerasicoccus arenae]|uniref:Cytochrome D oxidase subunit I n=1 Tax=Cerasicoccus arenae TaxID=424488 RepID=A0A8J3DDI0_9BACT|nr:cytochrome d ubiquinol oxidase subunit II [Cerasicoccus arenae]MBK1858396.1 cytochrome d ubiquinol oxidase subunit II [Cerasicoccus arenae]GHC10007.1 cytochrome D oxidase subunit I [Cerasicoccus arenae]
MDVNSIWFILVGILFTGYVMLDGFDLGVGILHLFSKKDEDRRIGLNAIGPVWDGNEVWLVTGGGALFAAFPEVYATAFSGFYDAFMLLLCALIFRAVAIEFRSKEKSPIWRKSWDIAFASGSFLSAFLIGVAMGNITWGIPLDKHFEFTGNFLTLIHPYSIFLGITTVALFAMHGNIYLILKTEGEFQAKLRKWIKITIPIYVFCFLVFNFWTMYSCKHIEQALHDRALLLGFLALLAVLAVGAIPREVHKGREARAFFFSCAQMAFLMMLFGASVFPNMIFSNPNVENSLNIYNGSSTDKTLNFMLWVAIIGVPIVLTYTACVYYIFRGKVKITEESY